jgi:hypothetical protein
MVGNLLRQSPDSENTTMLSFAAEHNQNQPLQALYLVNNTFVNDRSSGIFLNNHSNTPANLINNLWVGRDSRVEGPAELQHNISSSNTVFANPANHDYRLSVNAEAIDQGTQPGQASNGFQLQPDYQYRHPLDIEPRPQQGPIDVGAYEFIPDSPTNHK